MKNLENFLKALETGGVMFVETRHDDSCPGAHGRPEKCNCVPDVVMHNDEKRGIAVMAQSARERKAADAREAK